MGGRVYDPLAGRFTTADPIMQAPFALTQGQNRYAYVFNDPINLTDPSGFSADDERAPSWVTDTGAIWWNGSVALAAVAAHNGFAAALPGIAGLANLGSTFLMNIGGGSTGGTFTAPAPTAAPTANPNHPDAMSGVGNASGGGSPLAAPAPAPSTWPGGTGRIPGQRLAVVRTSRTHPTEHADRRCAGTAMAPRTCGSRR